MAVVNAFCCGLTMQVLHAPPTLQGTGNCIATGNNNVTTGFNVHYTQQLAEKSAEKTDTKQQGMSIVWLNVEHLTVIVQ